MHVFGEAGSFVPFHGEEVFQLLEIGIEHLPEPATPHDLRDCLLVRLWNIKWLLQVLQVLNLLIELILDLFQFILSDHVVNQHLRFLSLLSLENFSSHALLEPADFLVE